MQAAIDCCFFPLYEVEKGKTTLTYDPDILGTRIPAANWFKQMGKTKHLAKPKNADIIKSFETEVDRRWKRLKAMHEHEEL
jgi:pyruvate ferredoxin oxidoreductase alpha subunit